MKKLIVSNWISLDGYISGPNGELDWILGDGQLAEYETTLMQQVDTTLFGRKTYEQLSQYWGAVPNNPQAMDWEKPYAEMINAAHHDVPAQLVPAASDEVIGVCGGPGTVGQREVLQSGERDGVESLLRNDIPAERLPRRSGRAC